MPKIIEQLEAEYLLIDPGVEVAKAMGIDVQGGKATGYELAAAINRKNLEIAHDIKMRDKFVALLDDPHRGSPVIPLVPEEPAPVGWYPVTDDVGGYIPGPGAIGSAGRNPGSKPVPLMDLIYAKERLEAQEKAARKLAWVTVAEYVEKYRGRPFLRGIPVPQKDKIVRVDHAGNVVNSLPWWNDVPL